MSSSKPLKSAAVLPLPTDESLELCRLYISRRSDLPFSLVCGIAANITDNALICVKCLNDLVTIKRILKAKLLLRRPLETHELSIFRSLS